MDKSEFVKAIFRAADKYGRRYGVELLSGRDKSYLVDEPDVRGWIDALESAVVSVNETCLLTSALHTLDLSEYPTADDVEWYTEAYAILAAAYNRTMYRAHYDGACERLLNGDLAGARSYLGKDLWVPVASYFRYDLEPVYEFLEDLLYDFNKTFGFWPGVREEDGDPNGRVVRRAYVRASVDDRGRLRVAGRPGFDSERAKEFTLALLVRGVKVGEEDCD